MNKEEEKSVSNNFRTKNFGDKVLVVTDQGGWVFLEKKEFDLFIKEDFNENLSKKLKGAGVLIDNKNFNDVVERQRIRHSHLFCGTSLHIMAVTSRCNLICSYCHSQAKSKSAKGYDMDKETAKKVVDFMFQSPSSKIKIEFQGGEPLLNFEVIKETIEYAKEVNKEKKKDLKFALVTNLTNMDDEKIEYLTKNLVGICTSLDGPKNVHDKLRIYDTKKGSYDDVVKWINKIKKEHNYSLHALMVTTRHSLDYPKEIVDEYVRLGFNEIQIKFMNNLGYAQKFWEKVGYSAEEFLEFWKKAIDYIVDLNIKGKQIHEMITTYILKKILTKEPNVFVDLQSPCGAAINQLAYDHKGDIFTCDEGRQYELFKLGNVSENSYKGVLSSNEATSIIAASTNDCYLCDACVYKPYCGLCPVCCYAETGNLVPKLSMERRCKILKGMFDYIFEKLISSEKHKKVFNKWAKMDPR